MYNFTQAQVNHITTVFLTLLHQRLGHLSASVMKILHCPSNNLHSPLLNYFICFQAKQSRNKFPLSSSHSSNLFDLIYCDVWGPYKQKSTCVSSYFLSLVDDHSCATWVYLVFVLILSFFFFFFVFVQNQFQ